MSYVGPHYAAANGRQAVRILVVSMQVGDKRPVTLDQRSVRVRSRIDMTPGERNAHMRAVTLALQLLRGQPPDAGYENLPVGGPFNGFTGTWHLEGTFTKR